MSDYYDEDGSPKRCYKCGCVEFTSKCRSMLAVLDNGTGPELETEYFCASCGVSVAYWAYGSFDPGYLNPPATSE